MATKKNRDAEVITLGSGDLMIKEYTDTIPQHTEFTEADLLGRIQGGATLEYNFKFHYVSINSIIACLTVLLRSVFKFHYVSINSKPFFIFIIRQSPLNSIMFLLIPGLPA